MTDVSTVLDYWTDRIGRDLTPFTDAGTEVEIVATGRVLRATWIARAETRSADFHISADEGVDVVEGGERSSYRGFLVGPRMADLMSMAKAIVRTHKHRVFVDTGATTVDLDSGERSDPESAVSILRRTIASDEPHSTRVTMVTGDAGAGKTQVLTELVRSQADAYLAGKASRVLLYVDAQGKALARFSEALATELDDLRSPLNYHHVAILTRVGALVPVIDGFDELLGVSGYEDAFNSLAAFIEELDGQGQVVAAARSSFYQEEFVARASSVSALGRQAWSQVLVEVQSWGPQEVEAFIHQRISDADDASQVLASIDTIFVDRAERLREKPLFVARVADLLLSGAQLTGGEDLLEELVTAFIERERHEKLLDRSQRPLLEAEEVAALMIELAEEMWNQETRELNRRSVREVAEFVLTLLEASEDTVAIVMERMPTLAFLTVGQRAGSVAFEHELFFAYFLGRRFSARLSESGDALRILLSRSVLPPEVGRTAYRQLLSATADDAGATLRGVLGQLAAAGAGDAPRTNQVRENAGRIAEESLMHWFEHGNDVLTNAEVANLTFAGGALPSAHFRDCRFATVEFRRTDLRRTRFTTCSAHQILLNEVTVDPGFTRLELAGFDHRRQLVGLKVHSKGQTHSVYDPVKLTEVLISVGALTPDITPSVRTVAPEFIELMERLIRTYMRANPVCTSDDTMRSLFRDPNWRDLETLLVAYGMVTVETRAARGPSKTFLRRQFLPEVIMAGMQRDAAVPPEVSAFWDALETEVPK